MPTPTPARNRRSRVAGKIGAHDRHHPEDSAGRAVLRTELEIAKREDDVDRLVRDWPPLTPEQRDRIIAAVAQAVTSGPTERGGK